MITIHRTIFKELVANLAIIIFSLSILLFMEKFVRITRLFMGKGADLIDVAKIFMYVQPSILLLSIPMAILISVFLTYGRMSTDSELVVLKGCGMSFWGISKASVALSIFCFLGLLFISLYVLPKSMISLKHTIQEAIIKKASMTFQEETFSDVFKGTVIYVKDIPAEDKFRGIFVYREVDKESREPVVIVAENGVMSSDHEKGLIKLSMNNGLIHTYEKNSSSEITFSSYDFVLNTGIESVDKTEPEEIETIELWKGRRNNVSWDIELYHRIALPFACIIFGILGPALSSKIGKIGRLGGFSLSLTTLILYYAALLTAEGLAESGKISPALGGWSADIIFGIVAAVFFIIAYYDKPLKRL